MNLTGMDYAFIDAQWLEVCHFCKGDGEFGDGDCPRCCGNGLHDGEAP